MTVATFLPDGFDPIKTAVALVVTIVLAIIINLTLSNTKGAVDEKAFEGEIGDTGWADDDNDSSPVVVRGDESASTVTTPEPAIPEAAAPKPTRLKPKPKPRSRAAAGPHKIGDRVVLRNLVGRPELNGKHGTISDQMHTQQERYPVDIDLLPGTTVSVKVCNLTKESPVVKERCDILPTGCVSELHLRVLSFITTTIRNSCVASLQSQAKTAGIEPKSLSPAQIVGFGWQYWIDPKGEGGVYPSLYKFMTETTVENKEMLETLEKQLNPAKPEGSYQLVKDSFSDERAVKGWNCRIYGDFWVVKQTHEGTIVVPTNNVRAAYCVVGLENPLFQIVGNFPRPAKFRLTLLPWFGRLIHHPYLVTTSGSKQVELATPAMAEELMDAVEMAEEEGRVVGRLAQLEVEGGSREGVPFRMMTTVPNPGAGGGNKGPPPKPQEPATDDEKRLVEQVKKLEPLPTGPQGQLSPVGGWNFIRRGETNETNPKHEGMVVAHNGQQIAAFKCAELKPVASEILRTMLAVAAKVGARRANVVGVDEFDCFSRMQFLLKDVEGTRVVGLNVTRKGASDEAKEAGAGGKKLSDISE